MTTLSPTGTDEGMNLIIWLFLYFLQAFQMKKQTLCLHCRRMAVLLLREISLYLSHQLHHIIQNINIKQK